MQKIFDCGFDCGLRKAKTLKRNDFKAFSGGGEENRTRFL